MDVVKEKIVLACLGSGGSAEVHASYEAGCFGFGLYRQLSAMGVAVLVAAPGLIPRKPSDHVKTDRRDARTIALALRAGQLTGIYIPTAQDESVRDYLRMYEDLRGDLRICKQRILHFLLRWAAVSNPRISVWSIVEKSLLRLFDYPPLQRGGKT